MSRLISREVYEKRLKDSCLSKGVEYLGLKNSDDPVRSRDKFLLSCSNGHPIKYYEKTINSFLSSDSSQCNECKSISVSKNKDQKTDEEITEEIASLGVYPEGIILKKIISPYNSSNIEVEFHCPACKDRAEPEFVFRSKLTRLRKGGIPCYCSRNKRLSSTKIKGMVDEILENTSLEVLTYPESNSEPVLIKCEDGHLFDRRLGALTNNKTCPHCSNTQKKIFYVINMQVRGVNFIKVGITANLKLRLYKYNSSNKGVIISKIRSFRFSDAHSCRVFESQVKKDFKCRYISEEDMPDGWTETISVDDYDSILYKLNALDNAKEII